LIPDTRLSLNEVRIFIILDMGTKSFLAISIIVVLLIGTVSFDATFADKDEDKGKKDKTLKTFESECAKKLDKKKLNLDGLFCQAILGFQFTVD
jgi:hypothetical protein